MGPDGTGTGTGRPPAGRRWWSVPAAPETPPPPPACTPGASPSGFLSFLGPGFLTRLYRRIVRTPGSFLLVADADGPVVGFVAGSADVARALPELPAPRRARRGPGRRPPPGPGPAAGVETLRHGARGRRAPGGAPSCWPSPWTRPTPGTAWAARWSPPSSTGWRRPAATAAYVVVGADNAAAVGLYRRAGFSAADEFELHAGTRSLLMQWTADAP